MCYFGVRLAFCSDHRTSRYARILLYLITQSIRKWFLPRQYIGDSVFSFFFNNVHLFVFGGTQLFIKGFVKRFKPN